MGQREGDLRLNLCCPPHHVLLHRLTEQSVAVGGVVEILNGLVEGFRREGAQLLLEGAEGDGALVEILRALRCLKADAVFHEIVDPPVAVLPLVVPALPCFGGNQVQGAVGIVGLLAQVGGDGGDVLLQPCHIREGPVADLLEDVPPPGLGDHQIGFVDVSAAVALTADSRSIQPELLQNGFVQCFHLSFLPISP